MIFKYYSQFLEASAAFSLQKPVKEIEMDFTNPNTKGSQLQGYLEEFAKLIVSYKEEMEEKKRLRKAKVMGMLNRSSSMSSEKRSAKQKLDTVRTMIDFYDKKMSTGSPTRATAHQTGYGSVDFAKTQTDIYDIFKSRMLNEKVPKIYNKQLGIE